MTKKVSYRRFSFIAIALSCIFVLGIRDAFAQNSSIVPSNTQATQQSTAQNTAANSQAGSDSIALVKKKQGFSNFFAKLFGKYKTKTPKDTATASKKKSDTTKTALKIPRPALLKFTQGGITWTSLYTQGVNLNTGVTGLYNLGHVFQDFNVAGIPMVGEATGVTEDGKFIKDYSSYSINFDSKAFLGALEKRAKDGEMNKLAAERSQLPSGQHMSLSDSMKAFEDTRAKLTSPSYQAEIEACKQRLQKIEDSMSKSEEKTVVKDAKKDTASLHREIKDSVKKDEKANSPKQDSLRKPSKEDSVAKSTRTEKDSLQKNIRKDTTELHSLRQKIVTYEKLEKRYEQLFEIKKNYSKLTQADSASKNEEAKYEKEKGSLSNSDNAIKSLEQNKMLKPYEKFLSGFQYITIGRANPEISEFTLHNFMMDGIDIGYKTGDIYVSGGYGKEQAVVDPYLMTGINVPTYNRTVEFGSIGIGSPKESNLYATVINISNPASVSVLSESNWIFDLSKKIVLAKNFDVTGEIAHSYFTYLPNKLDSAILPTVNPNSSDLAYAIKAHGIIPVLNTDIQADYLNTGNNYITLGNQFLQNGTKTYRIKLKQKVSTKLTLELGGAHVIQNQNGLTGTQGTDNWVDAGVKYKPVSAVDLEFNYSPRQFQQQQGTVVANNITSNINQISFTSNVRAEVLDRSTLSTIFLGNFQYSTPDNSTFLAQNINLTYYMLNEIIMLTNISSVNFTGNESRSEWTGDLSQFIGQGTYNMSIGKGFMFSSGAQWVEQPGLIANGAGLIGSIGAMFGKWGKLSIQLNCRNNIDNLFDFRTGQILVSTNVSILW